MKKILMLLLFALPTVLSGQTDTVFVNKDGKPVARPKAAFYRLIQPIPAQKKYKITDYYFSGKIRMEGISDQPDGDHILGNVTHYHENGKIESVCEHKSYKEGWITFYDDQSQKRCKVRCVDGLKDGDVYFYDKEGKVFTKGKFKNDKRYSGTIPAIFGLQQYNPYVLTRFKKGKSVEQLVYYANGQLAMRGKLKGDYHLLSAVYYADNGKKIGECYFDKEQRAKRPHDGTFVLFQDDDVFFGTRPAAISEILQYQNNTIQHRQCFSRNGPLLSTCTYTYGRPYNGTLLQDATVVTYVNGVITGPATDYWSPGRIRMEYALVKGQKEGEAHFYDTTGVRRGTGIFRGDKPFTGRVFYKHELCDYVEGQKNGQGLWINDKGATLKEMHYIKDNAEGEAVFYLEGTTTQLKGIYKNDQPYSGYFRRDMSKNFDRYEAGEKLETIYYNDKFTNIYRIAAVKNGTTKEFDKEGKLLYEGEMRNGVRFNGSFKIDKDIVAFKDGKKNGITEIYGYTDQLMRLENYVDNERDGETVVFKGTREFRCIYKKNKPFEGVVPDEGEGFFTYKDGLLNGPSKVKNSELTYVNGKKEGAAQFTQIIYKKGQPLPDTVRYKGIYKNDRPFEGDFYTKNTFEQWKNGQKNGLFKTFTRDLGSALKKTEEYLNDTLNGEIVHYFDALELRGFLRQGQPQDGWCPTPTESQQEERFRFYAAGQPTQREWVVHHTFEINAEYRDGQLFSGSMRSLSDPQYKEFYENGRISYAVATRGNRDTTSIIRYTDNTSVMTDGRGKVLRKTTYTQPYHSGTTVLYDGKGKKMGQVVFENKRMTQGCYRPTELHINFDPISALEICKDPQSELVMTTYGPKSQLKTVTHFQEAVEVPWPVVLSYDWLHELNKKDRTIHYFDNQTGQLITSCTQIKGVSSGFKMAENEQGFWVEYYHDSQYADDRFNVSSLEELRAKMRELGK